MNISGIHSIWRMIAIAYTFSILIVTVNDLYRYIHNTANEIVDEVQQNWREIVRWIWDRLNQNWSWRQVTCLAWDFVKNNTISFIGQVAMYIFRNFKPAVRKLGKFLATKCRTLASYVNQLFQKVMQQSRELIRKFAEVCQRAAIKMRERGRAMINFLRVHIPIAFRNLLHDFNHGFLPPMEALFIDLMRVGRVILVRLGQFNIQVAKAMWKDIKDKLKQTKESLANLGSTIKDAIKRNAKKLGKRVLTGIKNGILHPLWEWVKSDWRRLGRWVWDHMSPRWRNWLLNIFGFLRDELNEHPEVRDQLEGFMNNVGVRVFYAVTAMIFLLISSK